MKKNIFFLLLLSIFYSCKNETSKKTKQASDISVEVLDKVTFEYAKGIEISIHENFKIITLTNAWPGAEKQFRYLLKEKGVVVENESQFNAVVHTPVEKIVVTSTTHIPSLEMLGAENTLVGFPNLNYISSNKTRQRITNGKVKELGKNESLNTEVLIDLSPDVVIGFAVDGDNKTFSTVSKTGIPVLYNSDWTETDPLGKAEWVKFFGVLLNKEEQADSIFKSIEKSYWEVKELAKKAETHPTVLSGAMYKDVWYLPQGDSWAAQFIRDANADYLWSDSKGTGSLSLNVESVLEKGKNASYWIGPGQFTSLSQLEGAHAVYQEFNAFKERKVFSFTSNKGETGGVLYYELAPNRPDIVLKDIVKILHPELLPNYTPYFFQPLKE